MRTFLCDVKSTTALTKEPNGSFEAILSTPTLDRDGEVVDPFAFEPLPQWINIDVDHAMTVERTVGSGRPFYDQQGVLRFTGTYASTPLAQMVRTLVDEGHIRTMSVAYMNARTSLADDGVPHITNAELLNAGIVGIPANRQALITASKALDLTSDDESDDETPNTKTTAEAAADEAPASPVGEWEVVKARVVVARARAVLLDT